MTWKAQFGKWRRDKPIGKPIEYKIRRVLTTPDWVLDRIPNDGEYHTVKYYDGDWFVDGEWVEDR